MTEKDTEIRAKSESSEWPFKGEYGQKTVRKTCKERRHQLLGVVKKIGIRNTMEDIKVWTSHFNVSERTIYKDFKWIKKNHKPSDLEEIKIDLEIERDQVLKQALRILSVSTSNEERLKAISTLMQAGKHIREELEGWGEKPKVAELFEHSGEVSTIFKEVALTDEEIKNERRSNRDKIKQETS